MIVFDDPFERLLRFAVDEWNIDARVEFVTPSELPGRLWWKAKGVTLFPDSASPIILLDATLRRGVQGTLDILAHELAHVVAGLDAEHGDAWKAAYARIYKAACEQPSVEREIVV